MDINALKSLAQVFLETFDRLGHPLLAAEASDVHALADV